LLDRMEGSRKVHQFSLGWVSFSDAVTETVKPASVEELRSRADFDPTRLGAGGTQICKGLEAAAEMVEDWQRAPRYPGVPMSAVVVLMTDGEDRDPQQTRQAAERIKALPHTRLAACFFATKGAPATGADLLRDIVSPPEGQNFKQVYDGE